MIKFILKFKEILFAFSVLAVLFFAVDAKAATLNEVTTFNVNSNFDASARSEVQAILVKSTQNLYFYVDKKWWELQPFQKQAEVLTTFDLLSTEFNNNIYPKLTSIFGSEWRPGVDGDNRITVFFHAMKEDVGGYFESSDEYVALQIPTSNEREMLYLSLGLADKLHDLKSLLAHEFMHLITFNQKDRLQGTSEEVWLNEARADFTSTILGYDNNYEGSNLQKRVRDFLQNPSDSLTEWQETKYDYAVTNVFMQYLVDHYGISVLSASLKKKTSGIASINQALADIGVKETFSQIFTNWTLAIILNDCSGNVLYCYKNPHLQDLRLRPVLNFLPVAGDSSLSVSNVTKNWSGNWQKIIGGSGDLKLQFSSLTGLNFQVPYIVIDKDNNYSIKFLALDRNQRGEIQIKDFAKYNSLTILPSLQTKTSGFNSLELTYPYTFTVSVKTPDPSASPSPTPTPTPSPIPTPSPSPTPNQNCALISNLYYGLFNSVKVRCLQQFLKDQGSAIYPEGLVTGNFFNLTLAAVKRFQAKYSIPTTGFVGPLTRAKINELLSNVR